MAKLFDIELKSGAGFTEKDYSNFLRGVVLSLSRSGYVSPEDPDSYTTIINSKLAQTIIKDFDKNLDSFITLSDDMTPTDELLPVAFTSGEAFKFVENSLSKMGKGKFNKFEKAEDYIGAADRFISGAEKLAKAITIKRGEITKNKEDAFTSEEWATWVKEAALKLELDPAFVKPGKNGYINIDGDNVTRSVKALEIQIDNAIKKVRSSKDEVVPFIEDNPDYKNFAQTEKRRLRRAIDNSISAGKNSRPNELVKVLSPEARKEIGALPRKDLSVRDKVFVDELDRVEERVREGNERIDDSDRSSLEVRAGIEEEEVVPELEQEAIEVAIEEDAEEEAALTSLRETEEDFANAEFLGEQPLPADVDEMALAEAEFGVEEETDPSGPSGPSGPGGPGGPSGLDDDVVFDENTQKYIQENFGMSGYFLKMGSDQLGATIEDPPGSGNMVEVNNIVEYIRDTGISNSEQILTLFQKTNWFKDTSTELKAFQKKWVAAGGTFPPESYEDSPENLRGLLDSKMDALRTERDRLGISDDELNEQDLWEMAYKADSLGFDSTEIRQQFLDAAEDNSFSLDSATSKLQITRNKIQDYAGKFMMEVDESYLNDAAEQVYLGQSTITELEAGMRQQSKNDYPGLASLIDQGYTPRMYFSTFQNQAEKLLGRNVDFMGADSALFTTLSASEVSSDGLKRPMTNSEFGRVVRGMPEWGYTDNARDEAYDATSQITRMFGAVG
jgi:hypothetical protein